MAGHSKWANTQHRKNRQDAKRGKIFTRLIKEITVAARLGGGDPASNPRLRLALDKAYSNNMSKENVERAIKRGAGGLEGASYEPVRYEGYGIGGAAVIVPDLDDPATQDVLRVFRGEATVADAPPAEPSGSDASTPEASTPGAETTGAPSTTVATPTDGSGPTTTVGPSVLIEDNGVGIFPPDDPTCR